MGWERWPLVVTTLAHLAAVGPAFQISPWYGGVAAASTAFSVLWHWWGEDRRLLGADYGLATAWMLAELWAHPGWNCLMLQASVLVANQIADQLAGARIVPYWVGHSVWHLLSAGKAWAIASGFLET